jgi:glyoxylase-like metal-dependent hydrolase (beta-lactamase superfamily II)
MKLHSIETGNFKLDGGAIFGVVPKTMWNKLYPADENNLINIPMRCLLIEDGSKKILVDCGMGEKMDPKLLQYYFPNGDDTLKSSLSKAGVSPSEITDVILTHLHFDHCGGAVHPDGTLVFANATHWVSASHWESAHDPNRREKPSFFKENFDPIEKAGKLKKIESESKVTRNVVLKLFYGHTDGLIVPFINYEGRTLVYAGDFIPTSPHIQMSYICAYDINPLVSFDEKEEFLEEAVEGNYTIFFEHDIAAECCSLQRTPKGVREKERFKLSDFVINK